MKLNLSLFDDAPESPPETPPETPSETPSDDAPEHSRENPPDPENARLVRARRAYARWTDQAEKAKALYPSLNLEQEAENPGFCRLLGAGVDVRTAYEIAHRDRILAAVMGYAAREAAARVAKSMASRRARPPENGMSASAAGWSLPRAKDLTRDQVLTLADRARKGVRTRLG